MEKENSVDINNAGDIVKKILKIKETSSPKRNITDKESEMIILVETAIKNLKDEKAHIYYDDLKDEYKSDEKIIEKFKEADDFKFVPKRSGGKANIQYMLEFFNFDLKIAEKSTWKLSRENAEKIKETIKVLTGKEINEIKEDLKKGKISEDMAEKIQTALENINLYRIELPKSNKKSIINFIKNHIPVQSDAEGYSYEDKFPVWFYENADKKLTSPKANKNLLECFDKNVINILKQVTEDYFTIKKDYNDYQHYSDYGQLINFQYAGDEAQIRKISKKIEKNITQEKKKEEKKNIELAKKIKELYEMEYEKKLKEAARVIRQNKAIEDYELMRKAPYVRIGDIITVDELYVEDLLEDLNESECKLDKDGFPYLIVNYENPEKIGEFKNRTDVELEIKAKVTDSSLELIEEVLEEEMEAEEIDIDDLDKEEKEKEIMTIIQTMDNEIEVEVIGAEIIEVEYKFPGSLN